MKKISKLLRIGLSVVILCGILYPLSLTLASSVLFPKQANGSLITQDGFVVGSELIGQQFDSPEYFWGRPSSHRYGEEGASDSSNMAVSSPEYQALIEKRKEAFVAAHPDVSVDEIPGELLMESGSGFDPHISVQAAQIQVNRIQANTNIDASTLNAWIQASEKHGLVNVLELNLKIHEEIK